MLDEPDNEYLEMMKLRMKGMPSTQKSGLGKGIDVADLKGDAEAIMTSTANLRTLGSPRGSN